MQLVHALSHIHAALTPKPGNVLSARVTHSLLARAAFFGSSLRASRRVHAANDRQRGRTVLSLRHRASPGDGSSCSSCELWTGLRPGETPMPNLDSSHGSALTLRIVSSLVPMRDIAHGGHCHRNSNRGLRDAASVSHPANQWPLRLVGPVTETTQRASKQPEISQHHTSRC